MITAVFIVIFVSGFQPELLDTLTLEYCQDKVENHYPLAQKLELQDQITELNKKIANTASYPQLNLGVQATYQSEVTKLPFPSGGQFSGPELSKDQYKATVDISQTVYNGGAVSIQKQLEEVRGNQQMGAIKVELHQIKEQVNQVYFGILLAQQQLQIVSTLTKNLKAQISEVSSKVEHGVVLPSQKHILEAELLKARQDSSEIQSNIASGYQVLSQLIGEEVPSDVAIEIPKTKVVFRDSLTRQRPEFDLFESNRQALDYQKDLAQTKKWPSFSAFGTGAYGRPGFNVFENDLHPYYIVGLRLQWNLWGARNASTQQHVYNLQKKNITEEQRAFERQLRSGLSKIREQIEALEDQLQRDRQIVDLREKVVAEKSSQMKNGTATATEYITELSKATQAKLSMMIRQTKLEQAKIDYQTTLGNQQ